MKFIFQVGDFVFGIDAASKAEALEKATKEAQANGWINFSWVYGCIPNSFFAQKRTDAV